MLRHVESVSRTYGVPLLATNQVHYHDEHRQTLQDVLTCVRHGCTIQDAGFRLFPNGERFIKPPEDMHRLFSDLPAALRRTVEIAERCTFRSMSCATNTRMRSCRQAKRRHPIWRNCPGPAPPVAIRRAFLKRSASRSVMS